MKYLMWLLKAAIFFVLFAFALNNQAPVTLHWFFGTQSQAPMVLVLLLTLMIGVALGVTVMLPLWWRARKLRGGPASGPPADVPAGAETPELPVPPMPVPDIEPPPTSGEPRRGL
ncbi:MAG TPA: LapA family protein [Hydrogenophaga sp.]|uniref:LapA family protein n=1 Tax=Hydrogenophaga sp. TaxID=1904254 RepID=UPI002B5DEE92|nr:LapA family protein [Hydrogenophaga sp.]HMN92239.1 LapA family protein [Hydrogenophaga sp.]HMP11877.1 LapA family protein [Hydrogenophaga sp.]